MLLVAYLCVINATTAPEKYFLLIFSLLCSWPCLGAVHTAFLPTIDCESRRNREGQRWKRLWKSWNPLSFYTWRVWRPERGGGDTLLKATQLIRGRELCLRIPNSGLLEIMGLCFASSLVHALQLETLVTEQGHSITEDDWGSMDQRGNPISWSHEGYTCPVDISQSRETASSIRGWVLQLCLESVTSVPCSDRGLGH